MYHYRKDWRTCDNCASKYVCKYKDNDSKECVYHLDDTDPIIYCHIQSALEPVWAWLKMHYPNEAQLLIDKNSAQLLTEHRTFYSEDFRATHCAADVRTNT